MLLGSIIFMAYRIYLDPVVMLCDDSNYKLFELKYRITIETANYRAAVVKCERYYDLQEQLITYKQVNPSYSCPELELENNNGIRT
jgi:hypothetical protein